MYRTFRSFTEIDWESFKDNVYGQIMKEIEATVTITFSMYLKWNT